MPQILTPLNGMIGPTNLNQFTLGQDAILQTTFVMVLQSMLPLLECYTAGQRCQGDILQVASARMLYCKLLLSECYGMLPCLIHIHSCNRQHTHGSIACKPPLPVCYVKDHLCQDGMSQTTTASMLCQRPPLPVCYVRDHHCKDSKSQTTTARMLCQRPPLPGCYVRDHFCQYVIVRDHLCQDVISQTTTASMLCQRPPLPGWYVTDHHCQYVMSETTTARILCHRPPLPGL